MSKKTTSPASASRKSAKGTGSRRGRPAAGRARAAGPAAKNRPARAGRAAQRSLQAARYLWAAVTALVIAALLFEPTMVWSLGVGTYMVAAGQFTGLWLVVAGYGMACLPAAFGLLIATGRFWASLTHALWVGAVYAVVGFLFLDQIIGALTPYGW